MSAPQRVGPREYATDEIVVEWHPTLCFHSQNCVKALPAVFDSRRRPWIDPNAASAEDIARAVDSCPSGALRWRRPGGEVAPASRTIEITPSPNGPLLVRGPIRVVRPDGTAEELPRAAFCRCGHSGNKPFCDGTHREVGFRA
ncbi:MAG TPA: (4Fe-4S)-binding protein [Gaiellaceae bacterium]|nr:(4Fe-4S)-binding protein [Gaiellaceae bacterium]